MSTNDIFNSEFSRRYDASNARFSPISANLHFLMALQLQDLPADAHILCVGVGTGNEVLSLADSYPGWRFTGVDPSADMLAVCHQKIRQAGIEHRCDLLAGYLEDIAGGEKFDAVLCLLVTHFIRQNDRGGIYHQIAARLKTSGRLIVAEIAADMAADNIDDQLRRWAALQAYGSTSAPTVEEIKQLFGERLRVQPPAATEALMQDAGFSAPDHFFQSLLIHAWAARK